MEGEVRTGGKVGFCEKRLGKWEKMVESFSDARARFFFSKKSPLFFDLFDDFEHRVGGAGEVATKFWLEHR